MATVCASSPTLTSNVISTSHSSSLTTSNSVTVIPGGVSSSVSTSCSTISPNSTTCGVTTLHYTSPGTTSTVVVTLTVDVNVPITNQVTFYGSSCRTLSSDTPYTPPPTTSTTDPPPTTSTTDTPTTTSTQTTSYSTVTTSSVFTTDGSTYTTYYTSTTTTLPVSLSTTSSLVTSAGSTYASTSTSAVAALTSDPFQSSQPTPSPSSNNTGAIVGGTLGGIAVLALLALLTWHMIKKNRGFEDVFRREGNDGYFNPQKDPLSDPYQYNPIGQQDTHQPIGLSPPTSPGFQHLGLGNDAGLYHGPTGNETGLYNPPGNEMGGLQHGASGNATGLSTGNEIGAQPNDFGFNTPNQVPVSHLRNPSITPLLVGIAAAAAGGGAAGSGHTRPNTSSSTGRISTSSDPLGPLVTHAPSAQAMGYPPQPFTSYPPALANYALQHQGPVQQHQDLGHSTSIGSTGTVASGSGSAGVVPAPMGSMTRRPTQYAQQSYRQGQQQRYEDPFARSGSPVSIQENRVLHVMNAEFGAYSEGSSSVGGAAPLGTPGLFVVGSTSGVASMDGKGRPLNMRGEKAALVHLDGGAYQDPLQSEAPSTPAPPAYAE